MRLRRRVAVLRSRPRCRWTYRLPGGDWLESRRLLATSPLDRAVPLHFGAFADAEVMHDLSIPNEFDLYSVALKAGTYWMSEFARSRPAAA
jgi:hypothetical protein